jgi:hypothetical protein
LKKVGKEERMYNLKILLLPLVIMMAALGGVAMAKDSVVTATVSQGIEVNAGSPLLTFNVGPNTVPVSNAVTVDVNKDSWSLTVSGSNSGYFYSQSANHYLGYASSNPLQLSVDTSSGQYYGSSGPVSVAGTSTLATGVTHGEINIPVNFIQTVRGSEPAVNDYQITLTYTGGLI